MKTQRRLVIALKEMMSKMPLDSISVSALAEKCNINRKTFYYHYQDIYDLLVQTFLDEKIEGTANNPQELLNSIYHYYVENQPFIDATLASAGKDLFRDFLSNVCYSSFLKIINQNPNAKLINATYRKSIARFYSSGFASSIIFYINTAKVKSLSGLKSHLSFLCEDFLDFAVLHALKKGEKNHD